MKDITNTVVLATSERMRWDEIDSQWTLIGERKVGDTFESDGLKWTVNEILYYIAD